MSKEKDINLIIANNISAQLTRCRMTQADLALKLDVSEATVSNWCKGIKLPRMQKFDSICSALNCSRSDLFNVEPASSITGNEQKLLENFNKLNTSGQEKVLEDIENMTYNPKYKKDTELLRNA